MDRFLCIQAFVHVAQSQSFANACPAFATLSSPLESYGLEFESSFKPTVADLLKFNVGWTHASFMDKPAEFAL